MANAGTACFVNVNGTIHAVVNWRQRRSKDDVIIGSKLSDEQAAQYVQLRQKGLSETDICDQLFPNSLPAGRTPGSVSISAFSPSLRWCNFCASAPGPP